MWTPLRPEELSSVPVAALATAAAPSRWHGTLQELGTHCRDGAFVVSGPHEVAAALASPALGVAPAAGQAGPAADLVARMARFSDGPVHRRRRALVTTLLPPVADVASAAGARANDHLRRRTAAFDIMPMARQLPAEVLARGLGLPPAEADRAAVLTAVLCDAIAPAIVPRQGTGDDQDAAARELGALLARPGRRDEEDVAAAVSVLFQARDATAALIGLAVLGQVTLSPGQRVEHVLRRDAPVQCTRRTALTDTTVAGAAVPAGSPVWVFVATAERGYGVPATFGSGPHGCPGAALATAIARQVVTVLAADGWRPVAGQRIELEPRPNIRMPSRVLVARP